MSPSPRAGAPPPGRVLCGGFPPPSPGPERLTGATSPGLRRSNRYAVHSSCICPGVLKAPSPPFAAQASRRRLAFDRSRCAGRRSGPRTRRADDVAPLRSRPPPLLLARTRSGRPEPPMKDCAGARGPDPAAAPWMPGTRPGKAEELSPSKCQPGVRRGPGRNEQEGHPPTFRHPGRRSRSGTQPHKPQGPRRVPDECREMSSAAARPCGWVPALRSAAAGMTGAGWTPGVPTPPHQPSRAGRVKSLPSGLSRGPRSGVS